MAPYLVKADVVSEVPSICDIKLETTKTWEFAMLMDNLLDESVN